MEALRYIPSTNSFSLESTEIPTIQNADDVLIEVRFAGLCGTDIHIQQVHVHTTKLGTMHFFVKLLAPVLFYVYCIYTG